MKNILTTIILILIFNIYSFSEYQTQIIDSLKNELSKTESKDKANLLNQISYEYWQVSPKLSYEYAQKALQSSKSVGDRKNYAFALNNLGLAEYSWGNYTEAIEYHKKALKIRKELKDIKGIGYSLNNLGLVYKKTAQYSEAIDMFFKSIEYKKQINNISGVANTYTHLCDVFIQLKNYPKAKDYIFKAIKIKKDIKDDRGLAFAYIYLSTIFIQENDLIEARSCNKKAFAIFYKLKLNHGKFLCLVSMGDVFVAYKKYNLAISHYQKALLLNDLTLNKGDLVTTLSKLAEAYNKLKMYDEAIAHYKKSLTISLKIRTLSETIKIYQNLTDIYVNMNDYKNAYTYHVLYSELNNISFYDKIKREVDVLTLKYEQTKEENKLLLQKKRLHNILSILSIVIIVIILGFSFFLYTAYLRKRKFTKELEKEIQDRYKIEKDLVISKEKAEESDKLKTSFLANMSHEIRTPLNAIIGFSSLLIDVDVDKEETDKYIGYINKSGNNLLILINDIIDIAKIEAEQLDIKLKHCDIGSLFKDIRMTFEKGHNKLNKPDILLIQNPKEDINLSIISDSIRLMQILLNLISNAIKFTDKGFVEYGYYLENDKIYFYVKDTGIGLTEESQKKIFGRFVKIEDDNTRLFKGAGLGLAISRKLVNLLGGDITIQSSIGIGSTFTFGLPLVLSSTGSSSTEKPNFEDYFIWKDITILIAENELSNYILLERVLGKTKANLIWAKNGKEAVSIYKNNPQIDIILMDIKMPIMDGFEATKLIKQINPDVPIIAQTAFVIGNEEDKCYNSGCDGYVKKPINRIILLNMIDNFLKKLK